MKKIPTVFVRDPETNLRHVKNEVVPGCEWVLAGEGVATRKYDGTCVLVRDGVLYARREVKPGKQPPPNFEAIETDENTGKTVGWEPHDQSGFAKFINEAVADELPPDGTYELVGPKIQGNPEHYATHELVPHGVFALPSFPRDFEELRDVMQVTEFEGIVWWHPDGRMAKLKKRDFPGRPSEEPQG
jgi:hypothetical protein